MTTDPVHELIDEACRARQAAVIAAKRARKEEIVQAAFDSEFADELAQAYSDLTPPELIRARYAKLFQQFRDWVSHDGLSPLPASGPVIANFLIRLGLDGEPLSGIKVAADAIRYYHSVANHFLDEAYIACAFGILARPDGGDGEPMPLGAGNQIITGHDELPMAAQGV
jgi:hypothetical protein